MLYRATLPVHTMRNSRPDEPLDELLVYWARTHAEARDGVIDEAHRRGLWYDADEGPEVAERAHGACSSCDSCWPAPLLTIADDGLGVLCHACAFGERNAACLKCGVDIGEVAAEEHGGLCEHCEPEAHERDQYDFERVHAAGFGGLG